jgi:PTH1 family peptidyl-tRNA hydrolase
LGTTVSLIVGLGNPGAEHTGDRHNAGFWLVDELAAGAGMSFKTEGRFYGETCKLSLDGHEVRLLKPATYMNKSGQALQAMAQFYKIPLDQILVAHDELDLPPGTARLKRGGGHGGHNGLRDIMQRMGKDFLRLRIGIGHPGHKNRVVGYVLKAPPAAELQMIEDAIRDAVAVIPDVVSGRLEQAMHRLHSNQD